MSAEAGRLIARLADALDRERALLVEGRFDALGPQIERREETAARIGALPPEALRPHRRALAAVRRRAERNLALLRAALDGVAAGRRRAQEIVEAGARLVTYDASGAAVARSIATATDRRA